jgi:hypothetical protein
MNGIQALFILELTITRPWRMVNSLPDVVPEANISRLTNSGSNHSTYTKIFWKSIHICEWDPGNFYFETNNQASMGHGGKSPGCSSTSKYIEVEKYCFQKLQTCSKIFWMSIHVYEWHPGTFYFEAYNQSSMGHGE